MITDKVLIFAPHPYNINNGGPSGFIAHNLVDKPRDYFVLSEELFSKQKDKEKLWSKLIFKIKKKFYSIIKKKNKFIYSNYFIKINAKNYKYIYFHECLFFEYCKELISDEQIVILQSHSPQFPSIEFIEAFPNDKEGFLTRKAAEKNAFKRANFIVFPNEECIPIYKDLLPVDSDIHYILSGAKSNYNKTEKYNLEHNKINLLYLGRRNEIKGFDLILESFRKAREKNKNLQLYIVGKGEKIVEDGIIDVGFSKDPISWYNSVDYVINANRQSYFDLSIIEALSTGVPIIMANNFGHSYFNNKSPLIFTFNVNNQDELIEILANKLSKRDYSRLENRLLYEKELSDIRYYDRFVDFIKSIIK